MVAFVDGPAKDARLSLENAPLLLRVVINRDGKVDALDQPEDMPREDEVVHVYRRVGDAGQAIVCSRGKGCKRTAIASYRFNDIQPNPDVVRDVRKWDLWRTEF